MALTRYDKHIDRWVQLQQTDDEEAREWARDYGGNDSWYWSPKWQAMTSITDGVTTVQDVADALARGDDNPEVARLAADYWLMVGRHVQAAAAAAVGDASRSWLADTTPDEDGYYPEPSPAAAATIAAAEGGYSTATAIVEDLEDAARAAWSAEAAAHDAADAAGRLDMAEVRAIYNLLHDPAYYAEIEGDGAREDGYLDSTGKAAETHVALGRTAADLLAARQAAAERTDPDVSGDAWGAELAAHAEGGHYTDGLSTAERDAERRYADAWAAANPDAVDDATGLTAIDSHDRMVASHHADQGYTVRLGDNPWNRPREGDLRDSPPVSSPPEHEQPGPWTAANPGTARVAAHQRADDEASDASHAEAVLGASDLADYARIVEHERDALYLALCDLAERTGEPIPPELDPLEPPTRTARHDEDEWSHNEAEIQAGIRWIHSDDHLPTKETHESAAVDAADVTAGRSADEVLAGLLDDLDQARAQLESGDARGDDKHELAERIEHLEEAEAAHRKRAGRGSGGASQDDHQQAGRDLAIAQILHEALYDGGPPVLPDQAAGVALYAEMWAQEALADYDHADDCHGCEHIPGAVHCTTQSWAEHEALMAVQQADDGLDVQSDPDVPAHTDAAEDAFFASEPAPTGYSAAAVAHPEGTTHGYPVEDAGRDDSGKAGCAEAVAEAHAAVAQSDTAAHDETTQREHGARSHADSQQRGATADQQSALGRGGDGHE